MQSTEEAYRLYKEIEEHTDFLLNTETTEEQRKRLQSIQYALRLLHLAKDDSIPVSSKLDAPTAPQSQQPAANTTNNRLLLAEDNPFTQKLMLRLLTLQGFQVTLAQNGQEALSQFKENPFNLILMDLRMPNMDGFEATTLIRQHEVHQQLHYTPIIAVTALTEEEDKQHALECGIDDYHTKPVRANILFSQIEQLITTHRIEQTASTSEPKTPPSPQQQPSALLAEPAPIIVDLDRLLKTVDGDWELLLEVTEIYFSDLPRQMTRIERALTENQASEIREAAHSLKGASSTFGRTEVFYLALALEEAGRLSDLQRSEELYSQLKIALKTMETRLKETIHDQRGESL